MVVKIRVLQKCSACHGESYLPSGETEDYLGRTYVRYKPCPNCQGSGMVGKWADMTEVQQLLEQSQCPHEHISREGSYHNSPDGVWDDVQDVCNDCGQVLK